MGQVFERGGELRAKLVTWTRLLPSFPNSVAASSREPIHLDFTIYRSSDHMEEDERRIRHAHPATTDFEGPAGPGLPARPLALSMVFEARRVPPDPQISRTP